MKASLSIALLLVSSLSAGELQTAARDGKIEAVRQLLSSGIDINASGEHGRTALHEAALAGRLDVVELLMAKGANRNALDDDRRTPLALAHGLTDKAVRTQIVTALLQGMPIYQPKESDPWSLQYAASRGQVNVMEMFIKLGVDVNAVGSNGNRALNIACLKGNAQMVELLLAHGADVNARSSAGAAPLHEAALNGNTFVGALLLSHGAKIDATEEDTGATPLYYAVSFGRSDFAKLLIAKGAAVNVKTKDGNSPLAAAKEMKLADVEVLLRKAGAKE